MQWQLTGYGVLYFSTAVIAALTARLAWRMRATPGTRALAGGLLAAAEWSWSVGMEGTVVSFADKLLWTKLEYIGFTSTPILVFIFVLAYTHRWPNIPSSWRWLVWVPSALALALAWTNEWHHLIWTGFSPGPEGTNKLIYYHGLMVWPLAIYFYALSLVGCFLLLRDARRLRGIYRRQMTWLLLSMLVPLVGSGIYLGLPDLLPQLETGPLSFALTGALLSWGIWHDRLFDVQPVAREAVFDDMGEGILVLDNQSRICEVNPAAERLLGWSRAAVVGQPWAQTWRAGNWQVVTADGHGDVDLAAVAILDDIDDAHVQVWQGRDRRDLDLRTYPLVDRDQRRVGRLVVLLDITKLKQAESSLQTLNANLERQVDERTGELRRLHESVAQRLAEQSRKLAALYEVILVAGQAQDRAVVLTEALERVREAMQADVTCLHQMDEADGILRLRAQRGLTSEGAAQLATLPPIWEVADGTPRRLADPEDTAITAPLHLPGFQTYVGNAIRLREARIGMLSVYWSGPWHLAVEDIALLSAIADQLGVIIENARLRQADAEAAILKERQRLARDMHDSVAQSLHGLVLSADTAVNRLRLGQNERAQTSLLQLANSARQALKEMRLLLYELRPVTLQEADLVEKLQRRLSAVEYRAGVEAQLVVEGPGGWPRSWDEDVYFVASEALNNALKHALAGQVTVYLRGDSQGLELEVVDNGQGFTQGLTGPGGMGLQTMAERAERLGGYLSIDTAPGQGTMVHLTVGPAPTCNC